ncbi:unnamed protein product [Lasius platythorax]|uniref:Uncharacterized protein n=1 Tax=Lasius platythorax TaxID=488582 RepID=A0AAV2MYM8_9HYME
MLQQDCLKCLSLQELQDETRASGITKVPENRTENIDLLLRLLEKDSPLDGDQQTLPREAAEEPARPDSSASGNTTFTAPDQDFFPSRENQPSSMDKFLPQFCSLMTDQMSMFKEQMLQQQKMMQQLFESLNINRNPPQDRVRSREEAFLSSAQDQHSVNNTRFAESASSSSGHSVKFLMSQIPTFGGTEDKDVELWMEKIESVAEIHNLSHVVMLSAATSKLNKMAR